MKKSFVAALVVGSCMLANEANAAQDTFLATEVVATSEAQPLNRRLDEETQTGAKKANGAEEGNEADQQPKKSTTEEEPAEEEPAEEEPAEEEPAEEEPAEEEPEEKEEEEPAEEEEEEEPAEEEPAEEEPEEEEPAEEEPAEEEPEEDEPAEEKEEAEDEPEEKESGEGEERPVDEDGNPQRVEESAVGPGGEEVVEDNSELDAARAKASQGGADDNQDT